MRQHRATSPPLSARFPVPRNSPGGTKACKHSGVQGKHSPQAKQSSEASFCVSGLSAGGQAEQVNSVYQQSLSNACPCCHGGSQSLGLSPRHTGGKYLHCGGGMRGVCSEQGVLWHWGCSQSCPWLHLLQPLPGDRGQGTGKSLSGTEGPAQGGRSREQGADPWFLL